MASQDFSGEDFMTVNYNDLTSYELKDRCLERGLPIRKLRFKYRYVQLLVENDLKKKPTKPTFNKKSDPTGDLERAFVEAKYDRILAANNMIMTAHLNYCASVALMARAEFKEKEDRIIAEYEHEQVMLGRRLAAYQIE